MPSFFVHLSIITRRTVGITFLALKKKNCLKDFKDKIIFNSSNVIYDQVIQMGFGPHVVKILLDGC